MRASSTPHNSSGYCSGRWGKGGLRVNLPVGDAVDTSGGGQVRDTAPVLDSHEQKRLPGRQQCCTRVEHRMCGVGPARRCQDGIARVTLERAPSRPARTATQAGSNSVSSVPPQLGQRPGRAGAR